jgi:arsenate reductase (thioredoxin)
MSKYNVLFVCTHNSARSIIGEAVASTHLSGVFTGYSAGLRPQEIVSPYAMEIANELGYPADKLRSKSWEEFISADAPKIDFIISLYDPSNGEPIPHLPSNPATAFWTFPDPSVLANEDVIQRRAMRAIMVGLKKRVEILAALPIGQLNSVAVQKKLAEINQTA